MTIIKNRIINFLIIMSAIILINFIHSQIAESADNTQIIIDENLKSGMALKDAIELLGPPENINISDKGTVLMPYDTLGLSIEVISGGTVVEAIHLQPSFKGRFASGLEIGADFQKILSLYNQPDIMTKEIIEYSDKGTIFKIDQGKLTGADLYSGESTLFQQVSKKATMKSERVTEKVTPEIPAQIPEEMRNEVREEVREEVRKEVREEVRKEVREEVRKEVREEVAEEVREEAIKGGREVLLEKGRVFDIFGFKVKRSLDGVVITEISPGSVASYGGLKVGERIRRASLEGYGKRNIYSVRGLEKVLKKAILRGNKSIDILQNENRYYTVEVPKSK